MKSGKKARRKETGREAEVQKHTQPQDSAAAGEPEGEKTTSRRRLEKVGEALYNCPYLLALLVTSAAVLFCSDEIGIRTVCADAQAVVRRVSGADAPASVLASDKAAESAAGEEKILVSEKADDQEQSVVFAENTAGDILEETENAGECKAENNDIKEESDHDNDSYMDQNAENQEKEIIGTTEFVSYEPVETDSPYYSDAGKVALTTAYPYTKENISYFNDAAFLGDSRTLGISDYAGLDGADFYCDSGMTIFKILDPEGATYRKTGRKEDLSRVLQEKRYGKIYIMLGMNELGYGNTAMYLDKYREVVEQIRKWQPDAVIYIMANLHVSKEKNNTETEFNNININDKNAAAASLANGKDIFYLDANPLFTDENGFLDAELTFDGVHLYAQHYDRWREFLMEHGVENKAAQKGSGNDGRDTAE